MPDDFDPRTAAIASTHPEHEAVALASIYVGDQLARIADAADVARDVPTRATLLNIERTAREVTALLTGGPSERSGWRFSGAALDADAIDLLLQLHDYLNDAERERANDGPAPPADDRIPPGRWAGAGGDD